MEFDFTITDLLVKILNIDDNLLEELRSIAVSNQEFEDMLYDLFLGVQIYIKNGTIINNDNNLEREKCIKNLMKLKNKQNV